MLLPLLHRASADRHVIACPREGQRGFTADATAGSGHQYHLVHVLLLECLGLGSGAVSKGGARSSSSGRTRRLGLRDRPAAPVTGDRKSTRLNSSHVRISYAVFCLKK